MQKRRIILGTYDTAENGWTLTGWQLSAAEQKTNYISLTGGDGSWDMSTALTDGLMRYKDRNLTVTLERSDGDRLSREEAVRHMVNLLDGMRVDIELPDDPQHHINGRLHVVRNYNDLAHAAVTVTAVCNPWRESNTETSVTLTASTAEKTATLVNNGRRAVVPSLKVTGTNASVLLKYGDFSLSLSAGEYRWPDLLLRPGSLTLAYSGTGTVVLTYREAVLE